MLKNRMWVYGILFAILILALFPTLGLAEGDATESEIDSGATAWMLTSTALVLLMVPGLEMFYGGLVRTKNVLSTMMHCYGYGYHDGAVDNLRLFDVLWE
jgi:hypothetical protein